MDKIEKSLQLYEGYIPKMTVLTIEESIGTLPKRFIFRLQYCSKTSQKKMCVMAKGESLPTDRGAIFYFYLRQLVLTQSEVAREFSRLYFLERRARQDAFLSGELGNIRVSGETTLDGQSNGADESDKLNFKEYV